MHPHLSHELLHLVREMCIPKGDDTSPVVDNFISRL
jgi:hypothetical protein